MASIYRYPFSKFRKFHSEAGLRVQQFGLHDERHETINLYTIVISTSCYVIRQVQRHAVAQMVEALCYSYKPEDYASSGPVVQWSKSWNSKMNEDKMEALYFSHRIRPPESLLTPNGRNIPFVNNIKYLCVIFDRKLHGDYT
jgi:hypothetical protein